MNIEEAVQRLEDWSSLENTELGELWERLASLWGYREFCTEHFRNALREELLYQAETAEQQFREHVSEVRETRVVRSLELLG